MIEFYPKIREYLDKTDENPCTEVTHKDIMKNQQFTASSNGDRTIYIFNADTGQLYRTICLNEKIISGPICTDKELYVTTQEPNGAAKISYFTSPNFNISRIVSLGR